MRTNTTHRWRKPLGLHLTVLPVGEPLLGGAERRLEQLGADEAPRVVLVRAVPPAVVRRHELQLPQPQRQQPPAQPLHHLTHRVQRVRKTPQSKAF